MSLPIDVLKFKLQERVYPYFEEEELIILLEECGDNINLAAYKGCLQKAVADDETKIGSITLKSNRDYWLGLAEDYKAQYEEEMKAERIALQGYAGKYKTRMERG